MARLGKALRAYLRVPRAGSRRHRFALWTLKAALPAAGIPLLVALLALGLALASPIVVVFNDVVLADSVMWSLMRIVITAPAAIATLGLAVWAHDLWLRRRRFAVWAAAAALLPALFGALFRLRRSQPIPAGSAGFETRIGPLSYTSTSTPTGFEEAFTLWGVPLDATVLLGVWALLLLVVLLVARRPDAKVDAAVLPAGRAPVAFAVVPPRAP